MKLKLKISIIMFLFILLLIPIAFAGEEDNVVEDEVLRNNLIRNGYDSDEDGYISAEELENVYELDFTLEDDGEFLPEDFSPIDDFASNLESIHIENIHLDDLSFLEQLSVLYELVIKNSGVSDISALSRFEDIDTLTISNGNVTDISCLENLYNLYAVDLSYNSITDASALSDKPNLSTIYLNNNNLTELPDFSGCESLFIENVPEILFYDNPNLTDISSLEGTTIKNFDISGTAITDISVISTMEHITSFNALHENENLKDVSALNNLQSLMTCNMQNTGLESLSLSGLSNLTELQCDDSNLKSVELKNLENLKNVSLKNNQLTQTPVIVNLPTEMINFDLSNNEITDISSLTELNNNSVVNLEYNEVNPYIEPNITILEELNEKNIEVTLGDCSRFEVVEPEDPEDIVKDEALKQYFIGSGKDTDENGKISVSELENVTDIIIDCSEVGMPKDYSSLKYAVNLYYFYISNVSNISNLSFLSNLEGINVGGLTVFNSSLTTLNGIEHLTSLTNLYISDCHSLSDISAVSYLTNLKSLYISGGSVKNADAISNLTKLEQVDLSNNDLRAIPDLSRIEAFFDDETIENNYVYFRVNNNPNLTDISKIANTKLKDFSLYQVNVSDVSPLKNMPNLKNIYIYQVPNLTDVSVIAEMEDLKTVSISYTSIEEISFNNKNNINYLFLSNNKLTRCDLTNINSSLEYLYLDNNNFSEIPNIENLITLKNLHISGNNISDISPLVAKRNSLKTVYMYDNEVNPYKESTIDVLYTLAEYNIEIFLGDCSRFEGQDEEIEVLTEEAKETIIPFPMGDEEVNVYPIDPSMISNVKENFISENFIIPTDGRIEVLDINGNILEDGKKIGSRSVITVYDKDGNELVTVTVAVKGDVSGNGELALFDAFKILIGTLTDPDGKNLDVYDYLIRDYNGDGYVQLFDAFKFLIASLTQH